MKLITYSVFFFISLNSFSQTIQFHAKIVKQDSLLEFNSLKILLKQSDSIVDWTIPDAYGNFILKNINEGFYSLIIKTIGSRDDVTDSLKISKDITNDLIFIYPKPCKFIYVNKEKPKCFGGHSDKIIPIMYGFPTKKTIENSKKGLVYLGGCLVSDCDPRYYCTIHKREL